VRTRIDILQGVSLWNPELGLGMRIQLDLEKQERKTKKDHLERTTRVHSQLTARVFVIKTRNESQHDVDLFDGHIHIEFAPSAIDHSSPQVIGLWNNSAG